MEKLETADFYNDGFGWICKHCERELSGEKKDSVDGPSRLMSEGEAESRDEKFSTAAMAKWADPAQRMLICPRCGIAGFAEKF